MKTKKIIERQLPIDRKYQAVGIYRGSLIDGDGTICDNCSALISNIATIKDESGKKFYVGLDCMKTLTQALTNLQDYNYDVEDYNATLRGYHLMKDATKIRLRDGFVYIDYTDKKGTKQHKTFFQHNFERFKFDLSEFDTEPSDAEKQTAKIVEQIKSGERFAFGEYLIRFKDEKFMLFRDDRIMRVIGIFEAEKLIEKELTK